MQAAPLQRLRRTSSCAPAPHFTDHVKALNSILRGLLHAGSPAAAFAAHQLLRSPSRQVLAEMHSAQPAERHMPCAKAQENQHSSHRSFYISLLTVGLPTRRRQSCKCPPAYHTNTCQTENLNLIDLRPCTHWTLL